MSFINTLLMRNWSWWSRPVRLAASSAADGSESFLGCGKIAGNISQHDLQNLKMVSRRHAARRRVYDFIFKWIVLALFNDIQAAERTPQAQTTRLRVSKSNFAFLSK